MDHILAKQACGRLGKNSETVEIEAIGNETRLNFPNTTKYLNKATVIGVELGVGNGTTLRSPKTNKLLMTEAEISTGRLHLEDVNRNVLEFPLRFFICKTKPILYVPIEPLYNFNPSQCYVYFATAFDADVATVLELNLITE